MFYVYEKEPRNYCEEISNERTKILVYSVQYKKGYPYFTIYDKGQWITRSAKHFVPAKIN